MVSSLKLALGNIAFNRTIVELKQALLFRIVLPFVPFNRTIVELKQRSYIVIADATVF